MSRLSIHRLASIGLALLALGLPRAAQETLWSPADAEALDRAQAALQSGSSGAALATLDDLVARYPGSVDVRRLRGLALVDLGRGEEARAELAVALSRGAFSADVLTALLQLDFEAGRTPAVLSTSRLLLLLEPDNGEWALLHADLLLENGQAAAAAVVYSALVDRGSVTPTLFERLARTRYADGEGREAASLFETSYYMGSEDAELPGLLARLWLELGDGERAALWTARTASPSGSEGEDLGAARRYWLAGDLARARDVARALADAAESEAPVRAGALELLGRIARREGATEASDRLLEEAVELGLEDPDVFALLGSRAFEAGDAEGAFTLLARAWQANRRDASMLSALVRAAIDRGRPEDADAFLRDHLEHNGLDDTARRLITLRGRAGAVD